MNYKPRNATEGFMLAEIEGLKKENTLLKEEINTLEEDIQRLNALTKWYKDYRDKLKENFKDTHACWQNACLESDYNALQLEEENKELKLLLSKHKIKGD